MLPVLSGKCNYMFRDVNRTRNIYYCYTTTEIIKIYGNFSKIILSEFIKTTLVFCFRKPVGPSRRQTRKFVYLAWWYLKSFYGQSVCHLQYRYLWILFLFNGDIYLSIAGPEILSCGQSMMLFFLHSSCYNTVLARNRIMKGSNILSTGRYQSL